MVFTKGKKMLQNKLLVNFDANNIEHRKYFKTFFTKNKWDQKSPRFILEQPFLDVPTMIQNKLMQYYLKHDFKQEKPKTKKE
jgi:hypothetical protein